MTDTAALRKLAKKATKGPYDIWDGNPWHAMSPHYKQGGRGVFHCEWLTDSKQAERNARYFAALDPQTVLALLDTIERLEKNRRGIR